MKFTKKPVTIDAIQNTGEWRPIIEWLGTFVAAGDLLIPFGSDPPITRNTTGTLNIKTLEGTMCAQIGDWIIRGVKGEFYPCKPDIFEATYEPAVQ